MIVAILSSFVIAIFIVGLAISYYHKQRKKQSNDSSYSITRYWRRQLASTSCDNLNSSLITNNKQSYPIVNETTSIIKNSFSWPEASMLHRQDQEQIKCSSTISSSGLSYSLTMEHITEPASLTFGLRWNDITKSLFVRVVSARDLFIYRRHRQPLVIDSYVRIELIFTSIENTNPTISYYHKQRKKQSNDSSYSITRYWRRQLASTSCDNLNSSLITNNKQSYPIVNETTSIIKNSFSWPEASMLHRQDQEQIKCSSTISSSALSYSLTMEHITEPASLTFGLRWNEITKSLFVRVVSARDLFIYRRHRQPLVIDSYVRIELIFTSIENTNPKTFPSMRTHIIKKNAYPIYDELFEFTNLEQINDDNYSIVFTISTYDTFTRDEIVGEVIFPIKFNILDSTEMTFTQNLTTLHKQLSNQELGQMLISLCYQPTDSSVTIIVLKAANLPRIGTTRLINPYFKIYMFYKNQRIFKKRSTIKRTTQTPVYNECFTFHIPNNDIENIYFDIILFDYDNHMKHEAIGTCSIGKEMNQHWNDVCHRQITKQIAHWYQLKSYKESIHLHILFIYITYSYILFSSL
ncbi:unnamed protein product [Rotaria sp. Silwood1]|nr:unnamed protein product [Rotaria sp. Silwood1]